MAKVCRAMAWKYVLDCRILIELVRGNVPLT
jgi:hypothetical protein